MHIRRWSLATRWDFCRKLCCEITSAPDELGLNGQFAIHTDQADSIQMVSLVRMSSISHHTNSDQRYLSLEFTQQNDDTLIAKAPGHGNIAPPGPYYLTVVNDCGVPSVSKVVIVSPAGGCYADFNGDGMRNVLDFVAFQNAWTAKDPAADCDQSGTFNVLDFVCFQSAFMAGCP
jgi:hypothetical protein